MRKPELRESLDTHCVDILDVLHVASYVWKAAKALCSAAKEQQEFVRERLFRILKGKLPVSWIEPDVDALPPGLRKPTSTRHAVISQPIRAGEYPAAGYPIATGVIEGAYRHLVKDRLERSGMKWTSEGAQAMLTLRSIKASKCLGRLPQIFTLPTNGRMIFGAVTPVGLDWDIWMDFMVVAKTEAAEPLLRDIVSWLSSSEWAGAIHRAEADAESNGET